MSKNKSKKSQRIRRLASHKYRLTVKRSNLQIYAQIIDDKKGITLISANSLKIDAKNRTEAAECVGKLLAEKALKNNINAIYLDRSTRYEGRLRTLCESIRSNGISF